MVAYRDVNLFIWSFYYCFDEIVISQLVEVTPPFPVDESMLQRKRYTIHVHLDWRTRERNVAIFVPLEESPPRYHAGGNRWFIRRLYDPRMDGSFILPRTKHVSAWKDGIEKVSQVVNFKL